MSQPWMPLYVGDYLKDTRRLTTLEHGAYLLLIMEYWTVGGLPNDDRKLARVAGLSPTEWNRVRENIAEFFDLDWKHGRIDVELARAAFKSESARNSAGKRWQKNGNAKAMRTHNDRMPNADANGMLSQPQYSEATASGGKPPDPDAELFKRGKEILGSSAGGQIRKLKELFGGDVARSRAYLEEAFSKENPAEYVAATIRKNSGNQQANSKGNVHAALRGLRENLAGFDDPSDKLLLAGEGH